MARRYQDVMLELVDAIVGGEYAEGAWMPSELELRERFGASRGVLREALRGLEERGLVAVQSGRGQLVRQRDAWDTRSPDVLLASIQRGPDPTVLLQAIDARAVVERSAARHASQSATDADLRLLAERVDALERAVDDRGDAFVAAEVWFHHTLALLSDNVLLAKLVEPLQRPLATLRRSVAPDRDRAVVQSHRRIVEGVSSREPALAETSVGAYAHQLERWLNARR